MDIKFEVQKNGDLKISLKNINKEESVINKKHYANRKTNQNNLSLVKR